MGCYRYLLKCITPTTWGEPYKLWPWQFKKQQTYLLSVIWSYQIKLLSSSLFVTGETPFAQLERLLFHYIHLELNLVDRILMAICLRLVMVNAKKVLRKWSTQHRPSKTPAGATVIVPRGHFAVYIGEGCEERFVVHLSYLKHDLFQELLRLAEEEFGFNHPKGGLTIPCSIDAFLSIISHLNDCHSRCS